MARTAATHLSERKETGQVVQFDNLRLALFAVHLVILAYVALGWLIPSRVALYLYTLLLPLIVIQWLLNGGASIVNNVENLVRVGRWNDSRNPFEGSFFKTLLQAVRGAARPGQVTNGVWFFVFI